MRWLCQRMHSQPQCRAGTQKTLKRNQKATCGLLMCACRDLVRPESASVLQKAPKAPALLYAHPGSALPAQLASARPASGRPASGRPGSALEAASMGAIDEAMPEGAEPTNAFGLLDQRCAVL